MGEPTRHEQEEEMKGIQDVCPCFVSIAVKRNIIKSLCQTEEPYSYHFDSGPKNNLTTHKDMQSTTPTADQVSSNLGFNPSPVRKQKQCVFMAPWKTSHFLNEKTSFYLFGCLGYSPLLYSYEHENNVASPIKNIPLEQLKKNSLIWVLVSAI